jgi:hypothetical protein
MSDVDYSLLETIERCDDPSEAGLLSEPHFKMPASFALNPDLSESAIALGFYIKSFINNQIPSEKEILSQFKWNKKKLNSVVKELKAKGYHSFVFGGDVCL